MRCRVYWNPYTATRTPTRINVNAPLQCITSNIGVINRCILLVSVLCNVTCIVLCRLVLWAVRKMHFLRKYPIFYWKSNIGLRTGFVTFLIWWRKLVKFLRSVVIVFSLVVHRLDCLASADNLRIASSCVAWSVCNNTPVCSLWVSTGHSRLHTRWAVDVCHNIQLLGIKSCWTVFDIQYNTPVDADTRV